MDYTYRSVSLLLLRQKQELQPVRKSLLPDSDDCAALLLRRHSFRQGLHVNIAEKAEKTPPFFFGGGKYEFVSGFLRKIVFDYCIFSFLVVIYFQVVSECPSDTMFYLF